MLIVAQISALKDTYALTKEHHQEVLDCKGWDYRGPLDHLDQGHHLLDTEEPGQNQKKPIS